tara:strand:- start:23235 stop:23753 length:519 start_codon:yes stop_codon:yes gene_type:complete
MALTKLNNQSLAAVTSAGLPSGSVIQVVQGVTPTSSYEMSSTTLADATGFNASITPQSSSSKILVLFTARLQNTNSNGLNNRGSILIKRGSTVIQRRFVGAYYALGVGDGSPSNRNNYHSVSLTNLDSPATTSQVTYQVQLASADTGNSMRLTAESAPDNYHSNFILMEIAG